jgi:hypothetical protein
MNTEKSFEKRLRPLGFKDLTLRAEGLGLIGRRTWPYWQKGLALLLFSLVRKRNTLRGKRRKSMVLRRKDHALSV